MADEPLQVSVIMPVYQVEAYLAEAIESVLRQTYHHFELVILDDASTDRSLQIAQSYASQDARIRLYQHSENMGSNQTYADLLNAAQNDWVFLLDSDDRMLPCRLERQIAFLREHPELVLAGALSYYIDSRGKRIGQSSHPFTSIERVRQAIEADRPVWFTSTTVAYHRPTALKAGGYGQVSPGVDTDLYSRIAQIGPVLCQPELVGEYRIHAKSVSVVKHALSLKHVRWISSCMRARRLGQSEPDLEEYLSNEKKLPFLRRLTIGLKDLSAVFYKRAVVAYSGQQYGQAILFGISCGLTWPPYLWFRIWKSKLFLFS